MCRWFAYISPTEPCLLEDVLVTPSHSLTKQVHDHYLPKLLSHDPAVHAEPTTEAEITTRNRLFNVDGFGMAWYTSTFTTFSPPKPNSSPTLFPAVYKFIAPPLHDSNFRSLCKNTATRTLFAHIRAATSTATTGTNCHPFTFGIYTIMHNGYISDFTKIKRKMCEAMTQEAYENVQGGTDTEHLAALLISNLCGTPHQNEAEETDLQAWEHLHTVEEMRAALEKTISAIQGFQKEVLGAKAQPNDLNVVITNGHSLVACRFRNHATEQPPSLYYSTSAGVTLNRQFPDHPDGAKGPHGPSKAKETDQEGHNPHAKKAAHQHGRHVIVASEPSTYKEKEWTLIEKNHVVLVGTDGELSVEKMKIS